MSDHSQAANLMTPEQEYQLGRELTLPQRPMSTILNNELKPGEHKLSATYQMIEDDSTPVPPIQ